MSIFKEIERSIEDAACDLALKEEREEYERYMDEIHAEEIRVTTLMEHLGIPYTFYHVPIQELDALFNDPERRAKLIAYLKSLNNKAFW